MSPTFIRKNTENQFPKSFAFRAQASKLDSSHQSYIWLRRENFKEKGSGKKRKEKKERKKEKKKALGGTHLAIKDGNRDFF